MSAPPKSILFLGSKPIGYRCLEYLLRVREDLNISVIGVLTQARKEFDPDQDLAALASQHGIPVLSSLDDLPECDILYSVQYHRILTEAHIQKARDVAVNLHMAPLPEYRGCNQFSFAIAEDRKEFGATLHVIDTRIDHGDIIAEKRFAIPEDCWVNELYDLTFDASLALFRESLNGLVSGNYSRTPQSSLIERRGTAIHYRKDIDMLKQIDLAWPADRIGRHIRATSMPGFDPPYAMLGNTRIYFSQTPE